MPIDRRRFIGLMGASLMAPSVLHTIPNPPVRYLSARSGADDRRFVSGFSADGTPIFDLLVPGRGHAVAVRPGEREAVLVARRPGRFLAIIDLKHGREERQVEAAAGRHFCGHGVFSRDGRLFYTTENDFEAGRGVIGVRDATAGYRQVSEFPSHGIGPHELLLGGDGRTLVVASGGILTHPDTGRTKLNPDTMSPSLAYLSAGTGELLAKNRLPEALHQLSIRHLTTTADGAIWLATQYEGASSDDPPLLGLHRPGESIRLLRAPSEVQQRMRNYCGSIASDSSGRFVAVSSPRGNLVTFWNAAGGFVGSTDAIDGCGVAPTRRPGEFLLTSGTGERWHYRVLDEQKKALGGGAPSNTRWDNHVSPV